MLLHVITTFFVMLLISVAIALPSGLWVVRDYLSYADLAWPSERGFNVFFSNDASDLQIQSTAKTIEKHANVASVLLIPKDEALKEYLIAADLPDIAHSIEENPLPNALTVYIRDSVQVEEVKQLTQFIAELETIDDVSYDVQTIVRFNAIYGIFNRMLGVVSGTFCVFALFVSATAVRIAIEARLHEIRILRVIGSPSRITRGPFLWCGLLYGVLSGLLAAVLLTLVLIFIEDPLQALTTSYGMERDLQSLNWSFIGIVIAIGAALGLTSAYYATWRHIRHVTINWAS